MSVPIPVCSRRVCWNSSPATTADMAWNLLPRCATTPDAVLAAIYFATSMLYCILLYFMLIVSHAHGGSLCGRRPSVSGQLTSSRPRTLVPHSVNFLPASHLNFRVQRDGKSLASFSSHARQQAARRGGGSGPRVGRAHQCAFLVAARRNWSSRSQPSSVAVICSPLCSARCRLDDWSDRCRRDHKVQAAQFHPVSRCRCRRRLSCASLARAIRHAAPPSHNALQVFH